MSHFVGKGEKKVEWGKTHTTKKRDINKYSIFDGAQIDANSIVR